MAIDTLLPKKIDKSEASYKSVAELNDALSIAEKEHIRNIALTGPLAPEKVPCSLLSWKILPTNINFYLYHWQLCKLMRNK